VLSFFALQSTYLEVMTMRRLALYLLVAFCGSICLVGQSTPSQAPAVSSAPQLDHFDAKNVDPSVNPCVDFYQYACNKWIANNPVPPDETFWGAFGKLSLWNRAAVHQTVLDLSSKPPTQRTAVEQKVADYWTACTDETHRNSSALDALRPQLKAIDGMRSKSELAAVLAAIHLGLPDVSSPSDAQTNAPVFGLGSGPDFHNTQMVIALIDQGGLGLPGRDFYLQTDAKSVEVRNKYVSHLQRLLVLAGIPAEQATANANAALAMETAMARSSMDIVKRRDPKNLDNEMSLDDVRKLSPSFDWVRYLQAMHAPPSPKYIVTSPEFFRGFEQLLQSESLDHWKVYLRTQLLNTLARNLSDDFARENFAFYDQVLFGAKAMRPLWRRCINAEDHDIGEALGQAYAARYFPPESKQRVLKLVKDIEAALGRDIDAVDWMSPETKKYAHIKLAAQIDKIGYPDHWRDYSSMEIRGDDHLGNVQRAAAFEMNRQLQKIGKPLDRTEWQMTPPTVNAYEDTQTNTINFPAGILQPPFFDPEKDDTVNYAATGAVIGHETTHGFDDQGRKFDAEGNLRDWWTPADEKAYDQRGDCIADEYTEFIPEAGVKQNGRLTQGENTADNGGIRLALSALEQDLNSKGQTLSGKGDDGLTALQRFFVAYANIWCSNLSPEAMRTLILANPHPLDKYRVNNVVSNMSEFATAFSCHKGQPMVRDNACRVW
jgi:putative endopeptidase